MGYISKKIKEKIDDIEKGVEGLGKENKRLRKALEDIYKHYAKRKGFLHRNKIGRG